MSALLDAIARADAPRIALQADDRMVSYGEMRDAAARTATRLRESGLHALGLLADNGIAWALADLAAWQAEIPCVPVPLFFSPQQIVHALRDAGVDGLLTDRPQAVQALLQQAGLTAAFAGDFEGLQLLRLSGIAPRALPAGTAKITYTSGTTGEPKGVCLSRAHLELVAQSLAQASDAQPSHRHLCVTPLATLLENIGGLYTPWLVGARCCVPSLSRVGLSGATSLNVAQLIEALHAFAASSAILAPQMLQALVFALEQGAALPSLHFLAVGGAPVSPWLLERAARLGLPVFEGYGLSECGSVVSLNTPLALRHGTAGKPLPHVQLHFAADGEILVDEPVFLGYLGEGAATRPWPTGDIGFLDDAGFLHVTARKKNLFITSYGRNVAPEWVERELTLHPAIAQAAVFGEGAAANCALIVPRVAVNAEVISGVVAAVNQRLPDYARIGHWLFADQTFTPQNGQATANGRLRRAEIFSAYRQRIESLYQEQANVVLC